MYQLCHQRWKIQNNSCIPGFLILHLNQIPIKKIYIKNKIKLRKDKKLKLKPYMKTLVTALYNFIKTGEIN